MFQVNRTNIKQLFTPGSAFQISNDGAEVTFQDKTVSVGNISSEEPVDPDVKFNVVGNTKMDGKVNMKLNVNIGDGDDDDDNDNTILKVNGNSKCTGNSEVAGTANLKNKVNIGEPSASNSDPDLKLDISGNTNCSGTIQSNEIVITSDYRLKTNTKTLDESFVVDQLRPVVYTKNNQSKKEIGFIAHELQEHYPDSVSGSKDGEVMQHVNYNHMIGILVNEIQMLKKRVSQLENHS